MSITRLKNLIVHLESWESIRIVVCYNCILYKKRRYIKEHSNISIRIKEDIERYCYNCDLSFLTTQRLKSLYSLLYYKLCI